MHASPNEYKQFHARRHRMILELLEVHLPRKVARCLDIGGGGDSADAAGALQDRFADELHGVDLGSDVEKGAKKGILAKQCNVDTAPLPYDDGFFDLIIFASVIEHLYNPRHALDEIARTLKTGGILLIEAPNAVALGRRLDALRGANPFTDFNEYNARQNKAPMVRCSVFYTAEEIARLLEGPFTLLETRYAMHRPPAGPLKALLREGCFRIAPRLADCFAIVARRNEQLPKSTK